MKRNIYVQFKQHQGQGNNPWSFFMEKNMNTEKIKHLNDNLRKTFANGKIVITPGVRALNAFLTSLNFWLKVLGPNFLCIISYSPYFLYPHSRE